MRHPPKPGGFQYPQLLLLYFFVFVATSHAVQAVPVPPATTYLQQQDQKWIQGLGPDITLTHPYPFAQFDTCFLRNTTGFLVVEPLQEPTQLDLIPGLFSHAKPWFRSIIQGSQAKASVNKIKTGSGTTNSTAIAYISRPSVHHRTGRPFLTILRYNLRFVFVQPWITLARMSSVVFNKLVVNTVPTIDTTSSGSFRSTSAQPIMTQYQPIHHPTDLMALRRTVVDVRGYIVGVVTLRPAANTDMPPLLTSALQDVAHSKPATETGLVVYVPSIESTFDVLSRFSETNLKGIILVFLLVLVQVLGWCWDLFDGTGMEDLWEQRPNEEAMRRISYLANSEFVTPKGSTGLIKSNRSPPLRQSSAETGIFRDLIVGIPLLQNDISPAPARLADVLSLSDLDGENKENLPPNPNSTPEGKPLLGKPRSSVLRSPSSSKPPKHLHPHEAKAKSRRPQYLQATSPSPATQLPPSSSTSPTARPDVKERKQEESPSGDESDCLATSHEEPRGVFGDKKAGKSLHGISGIDEGSRLEVPANGADGCGLGDGGGFGDAGDMDGGVSAGFGLEGVAGGAGGVAMPVGANLVCVAGMNPFALQWFSHIYGIPAAQLLGQSDAATATAEQVTAEQDDGEEPPKPKEKATKKTSQAKERPSRIPVISTNLKKKGKSRK